MRLRNVFSVILIVIII